MWMESMEMKALPFYMQEDMELMYECLSDILGMGRYKMKY
jgi:hypothetical protein